MKLRDYQKTAVIDALATSIGQIVLPTGTGKSVIQATIIEEQISNTLGFGVYAILTPRILLTNQLMESTVRQLGQRGFDLKVHTIHSGDPAELLHRDDDADYRAWLTGLDAAAGTDRDACMQAIEDARRENRPLLICSTYHSVNVLRKSLEQTGTRAAQVLCDEAHYIVQDDFFTGVESLKLHTNRIHFFTATRKVAKGDEIGGRGMDNTEFYGNVIVRRTPNEMIKAGFMVRPRIHTEVVPLNTNWGDVVWDGFVHHEQELTEQQRAKMLVCCEGSANIAEICTAAFMKRCKENNVMVFDISSKFGPRIDGETTTRNTFLKTLREYRDRAIVLHINILTEGIDVPDMTGLMPIRNMEMARLLQSIGRATRPDTRDLDANAMPVHTCVEDMIKPYAWIVIPTFEGNMNKYSGLKDTVDKMRMAGFKADEEVIIAYDRGIKGVVHDPAKGGDNEKKGPLASMFNELFHDYETAEYIERLLSMTVGDMIAAIPAVPV